jgi:tRNA dimethylallyltransferase
MINESIPLIVILGPTGSGKTALATDLAIKYSGEIVCADSRTIYRHMSIGTAKPTAAEREAVLHHLLDIREPSEKLSVAEFKHLAEAAITEVAGRGNVPFLVGGSGLYIDSILYDYQFPAVSSDQRSKLNELPDEELKRQLEECDPEAYERVDLGNRRRVIRAIETAGVGRTKRSDVRPHTLMLGLDLSKEVIRSRIERRVQEMLKEGLIDEIRYVGETYGWDSEAMTGIGYRAFKPVILDGESIEVGIQEFIKGDMQLVKKQLTWFKRNSSIHWVGDKAEADLLVRQFLARTV